MTNYLRAANYINEIYESQIETACKFHGDLRENLLAQAIKNRDNSLNKLKKENGMA